MVRCVVNVIKVVFHLAMCPSSVITDSFLLPLLPYQSPQAKRAEWQQKLAEAKMVKLAERKQKRKMMRFLQRQQEKQAEQERFMIARTCACVFVCIFVGILRVYVCAYNIDGVSV